MGPFSKKLIDDDVLDWQFEQYEILIQNFSSAPGLSGTELWEPIPHHFGHPDDLTLGGKDLARFVYDRIKTQCRFSQDVPIELKIIATPKGGAMGGTAIVHIEGASACGFYQIEKKPDGSFSETITIDEALCDNPTNLIATLSHELAHALHNRVPKPLNIEPELYELFTDLTAIYLGYGIFLANTRFEFSQFQDGTLQGWRAGGAGYLPEADMVMALAIFMSIKNIQPDVAIGHLKPRLGKMLTKAFKQLDKHKDEIAHLKALEPIRDTT